MNLAISSLFLLIIIFSELLYLSIIKKETVYWKEVIFNINSGHIFIWLIRGLLFFLYGYILSHWSLNILDGLNTVLLWILAFITWDFLYYWSHRLHHKIKFLWASHVVHHEGEHYNLSLGARNSWYAPLTAFPFYSILAFIGLPLEIYFTVIGINYVFQLYSHNALIKINGWIGLIFITPNYHKVHHSKNKAHLNKNFGGTFIIWDRIFGTFQDNNNSMKIEYGTEEYYPSYNIAYASILPFIKYFKLSIFFPSYKKSFYKVSDKLIAVGGILLFLLLSFFIRSETSWEDSRRALFFTLIFMSVLALGSISEGKKWGLFLWLINFMIICPLIIFIEAFYEPYFMIIVGLLFIYCCILLVNVLNNKF